MSVNDEGIAYWPPCPKCGGPVGCVGRPPRHTNYLFSCNEHNHQSEFTYEELLDGQFEWLALYRRKCGNPSWPRSRPTLFQRLFGKTA